MTQIVVEIDPDVVDARATAVVQAALQAELADIDGGAPDTTFEEEIDGGTP